MDLNILKGKKIYFDANVFIYLLEGFPPAQAQLSILANLIENHEIQVCTSELTIAELLVKPYAKKANVDTYLELFRAAQWLEALPIGKEILIQAAKMRAYKKSLHLPDAIHLATALYHQCDGIISNDRVWKAINEIPVYSLTS